MDYFLNVIRKINGKYRVSHARGEEAEIFSHFPEAVNRILQYSKEIPEVFLREPIFLGLDREEEKTIRGIRELVLEKRYS